MELVHVQCSTSSSFPQQRNWSFFMCSHSWFDSVEVTVLFFFIRCSFVFSLFMLSVCVSNGSRSTTYIVVSFILFCLLLCSHFDNYFFILCSTIFAYMRGVRDRAISETAEDSTDYAVHAVVFGIPWRKCAIRKRNKQLTKRQRDRRRKKSNLRTKWKKESELWHQVSLGTNYKVFRHLNLVRSWYLCRTVSTHLWANTLRIVCIEERKPSDSLNDDVGCMRH